MKMELKEKFIKYVLLAVPENIRYKNKRRFPFVYIFDMGDKLAKHKFVKKSKYRRNPLSVFKNSKDLRLSFKDEINADIRNGCQIIKEETYMKVTFQESTAAEKKPVEKKLEEAKIILSECTEAKEYVPEKYWFKDTGILNAIRAGIKYDKAVLLTGETGTGKTSSIRHLAAETKNGFRRVNLNGSTTVDEFVGRWKLNKDREMVWLNGILPECMVKGLWLLCDEINACLPEISFVLHSLLDDDRIIVLTSKDGEIVRPHKDFRFFASMNIGYAGTHELNHALLDRFPIVVDVQYPNTKNEMEIIFEKSGNKDSELIRNMVEVAQKAREEYKSEKLSSPFSTRRLIDWATMSNILGADKSFIYHIIPLVRF